MVGGLPVGPAGGCTIDGATFGAKVINIEWFEDKVNVASNVGKIIKDKFGIFGEVKSFVKIAFSGSVGEVELVDGRVHAAISGE